MTFFFPFKGRTGSLKLEERKAELLCIFVQGVGSWAGRWILSYAGSRSTLFPSLASLSLVAEGSCGFGAGQRLFLLSLQQLGSQTLKTRFVMSSWTVDPVLRSSYLMLNCVETLQILRTSRCDCPSGLELCFNITYFLGLFAISRLNENY